MKIYVVVGLMILITISSWYKIDRVQRLLEDLTDAIVIVAD